MKLKAGHFYGKTSQTLAVEGFRFTEKSYAPDVRLPVHAHELAHFCFVLSGRYEEKIGARDFERLPAALVFYPPAVSHAERHFTNGRHFLVEICYQALEKVRDCGARLNEPVFLKGESALRVATRMYKEFSERDDLSALSLESLSTELLISASRLNSKTETGAPPVCLQRAKEYLRENFTQPPPLDELARAAGVHPTHLARTFRRFERCTAGDFVRRMRIEHARKKILSTGDSLVEIALDAGFADQAHFTRSFKKVMGMTPNEFRRLFKSR